MSHPYSLSDDGTPVISIPWVCGEVVAALAFMGEGRTDRARQQLTATLRTLTVIEEAMKPPEWLSEPAGDAQACQ